MNSFSATVTPPPPLNPGGSATITSVTPSSGNPGTQVTITGGPFGSSQGASAVLFGGTTASIVSWSNGSITAVVPSRPNGATNVNVLVATASATFTVGDGTSTIVYVNGYPTVNGNYVDCNGNVDNDPAHHTTDPNDTDPAHHVGQNCPAGSWVATH